jgi:hypothetical protein
MSTINANATTTQVRTNPLWRHTIVAGVLAAVATTALAAAAQAADVSLDVAGEAIPLWGFAQLTFIATVLGGLLAKACVRWSSRPHTLFVAITIALTALSCVPDLTIDATTATKVLLIATHLTAAAVVIPVLARRVRTG